MIRATGLGRVRAGVLVSALAVAVAVAGCDRPAVGGTTGRPGGDGDGVAVVATTTVLADLVSNVGGDAVSVRSLVPKGGEVHTFDPSPGDVAAVAEADVVVMNGLALDEWALDVIEGSGTGARVVELGEELSGVEYLEGGAQKGEGEEAAQEASSAEPAHGDAGVNPHLWLDVAYARLYVDRIAETLAEVDAPRAARYRAGAETYGGELATLDQEITDRIAALPAANRRIVSFHEAFPYFAEAYGLEVVGVVVEAPGQDPSAGEIAALVDAIRSSGARAVFAEDQFDDRLARTIAEEAGVKVESGLYNDSLGDPPADSYVGMMRVNAERIEAALR